MTSAGKSVARVTWTVDGETELVEMMSMDHYAVQRAAGALTGAMVERGTVVDGTFFIVAREQL
jgi:hypothetical protein